MALHTRYELKRDEYKNSFPSADQQTASHSLQLENGQTAGQRHFGGSENGIMHKLRVGGGRTPCHCPFNSAENGITDFLRVDNGRTVCQCPFIRKLHRTQAMS